MNDIRNGILINHIIHAYFDSRQFAFLKVAICNQHSILQSPLTWSFLQTPNHVLTIDDVPLVVDSDRNFMSGTQCPPDVRYTLQLIDHSIPGRTRLETACNLRRDAAFKIETDSPKPSGLLLHYHYGTTVIRCWGRNQHILRSGNGPPGPPPPPPGLGTDPTNPSGPSTSAQDRTTTAPKRKRNGGTAGSSKKKKGRNHNSGAGDAIADVNESTEWNEDDYMLLFWSNTEAARERRQAAEDEFSSRITTWASGVSAQRV